MRSENQRKGGGINGRGERGKPERTERQRLASIANGSRSRGPRPENRERVKLNALKHGLRAEQAVLPGEDPAEFQAIRDAYYDEWDPETLTRAMLVERLAIPIRGRSSAPTRADIAYRASVISADELRLRPRRRRAPAPSPRRPRFIEWMLEEPTAALADLQVPRPRDRPPAHLLDRAGGDPGAGPVAPCGPSRSTTTG